jgi:UDP-N-acetylglucosamine 2-epimerase (non-hydrolysing)
MRPNQSPAVVLQDLIGTLDRLVRKMSPRLIIVQGDTSSTLAGSLAGFLNRIPVAHVEAGLRTFDTDNPFPEEAFRAMVASIAQIHFAPTARAAANLRTMGISADKIVITGNTSIDALKISMRKSRQLPRKLKALVPDRRIVLVTLHRRENWDQRLLAVCRGILRLADIYADTQIIVPVHANPKVRNPIFTNLRGKANIRLIEPLPHSQFIALLQRSYLILTDSGGVQEEAPTLGVPVLVLRVSTERMEAIDAGVARLVGTDPDAIVEQAGAILTDSHLHRQMARRLDIFGDGHASERIVRAIQNQILGRSPLLGKDEQFASPVSP